MPAAQLDAGGEERRARPQTRRLGVHGRADHPPEGAKDRMGIGSDKFMLLFRPEDEQRKVRYLIFKIRLRDPAP